MIAGHIMQNLLQSPDGELSCNFEQLQTGAHTQVTESAWRKRKTVGMSITKVWLFMSRHDVAA